MAGRINQGNDERPIAGTPETNFWNQQQDEPNESNDEKTILNKYSEYSIERIIYDSNIEEIMILNELYEHHIDELIASDFSSS